jgi:WD40 repeat protein
MITVSDDSNYKIWDIRNLKPNTFVHCNKGSEDDLMVGSFNFIDEFIFATGGENGGMINIWDMRMPKTFLNDVHFHKDKVT